ncbi:MAG: PAS domain S-box protein, partial [Anaerolineae bacterium]|nr:PAS domain S-box protein [Anaerolineae bacterium]
MTSKGDQVDTATQMTNGKNGVKNTGAPSDDMGLARFFELSLDLLCVVGTDDYFKQLNPAFENTLGWSIEELRAKPFMEFVHPDDTAATAAEIEKLTQGALTINFENRFVCKDGSFKWLSWNAQLIEDGRLYAVARNVTAQKRAEETLSKQATDLAKVSELSTIISSITDPGDMLQKVVDLTKQSFNLYHAHIYLLDEASASLRLAAGADTVGRKMVADGWRIPLSRPDSLVAKTASTRQGGIINNVQQNLDHLPNPRLPKTKSELVVPIIVSDEVLGVLDVQSDKFDYFTDDDLNIQTTLAAQIGVALVNARSFERSTQAVEELNRLTRQLTKEGWRDHLESDRHPKAGYAYDLNHVAPTSPETDQANNSEWALSQNLTVHGETIGRIDLTQPETLTDDAAEIVKAVTDRLSNHLENLRLTEQIEEALAETEREATRLALLNEMSAQLNQVASEQDVFQLAAKFTPMVVQADRTSIAILNDSKDMIEIVALEGEKGAVPQGKVMP